MIRLALRVRREHAEVVLADLLELAPAGVEEIESAGADGELVEYAVYGAPGELPELPDLQAMAGGALVEVSSREVPDDWSERWKQFHRPVLIEPPTANPALQVVPPSAACEDAGLSGASARAPSSVPALHVRPPWESASDRAGALEIVIDPAQAFGTGAHATTRLCLELLLEVACLDEPRGAVLDVGGGSGVLAIAAAKLGYGPVLALDNDRESVRAILANAAVNEVEIQPRHFDLRSQVLPWLGEPQEGEAPVRPVVLANLLRPLLLDLAGTMHAVPAHLIASGLLTEQADEIAQTFAERHGLREQARREQGEWVALWLTSQTAFGQVG
jgi:ribosomal protein L11 methyltransferase